MIKFPETITAATAGLLEVLEDVPEALSAAVLQLAAVSYGYTPGTLTLPAQVVTGIRATLDAVLDTGGQVITVHPWTQGIAETGNGFYSEQLSGYLSPENALKHLADKLTDPEDSAKDGAAEMVCFYVSSNSLPSWLAKLSSLNLIFPFGDLPMCERRATQLADLWGSKMDRKGAFKNPHWHQQQTTQQLTAGAVRMLTEELAGTVEAYAEDIDPITELGAVIVQKEAEATAATAKLTALAAEMTAGGLTGGNAFYLAGSPTTMAAGVRAVAAKSPDTFCALVAVVAPVGSLQFFKEVFSV